MEELLCEKADTCDYEICKHKTPHKYDSGECGWGICWHRYENYTYSKGRYCTQCNLVILPEELFDV
jgi:hypothetical protein